MRLLLLALLAAGCDPGGDTDCQPRLAVFTDIDETLTTSDGEWLAQLVDPSHDPAMRPAADALMRGYADLGYGVFYVTARGEDITLSDDRTARQATEDWLLDHGFPWSGEALYLAEGVGVAGEEAVAYKHGVIAGLAAAGWTPEWAYGNAESDILAFQEAGMAGDRVFLVGELAGTMDVEPVPGDEAFEAHLAEHLPGVPEASCP